MIATLLLVAVEMFLIASGIPHLAVAMFGTSRSHRTIAGTMAAGNFASVVFIYVAFRLI